MYISHIFRLLQFLEAFFYLAIVIDLQFFVKVARAGKDDLFAKIFDLVSWFRPFDSGYTLCH